MKPILAFVILLLVASVAWADEPQAAKPGCYFSTGDNDWLWTSPPTQSRAGIRAVFESVNKVLGCGRIYWRGIQSEMIVDDFLLRPEDFLLYGFWDWERRLMKEGGTSRLAVETAHELGMDIWGFTGLFEHGAQAASDSAKGFGPSPIEDRLRIEHPEWIPVDRAGIRRQSGPIEFAYPEARKAIAQRYVDLVLKGGYDGLSFYTYVEHCSMTFEDEFGYNEPIVAEYKRRYGRDIRTETFDKHAWYRLRGEYVTQFLRELKAALQPKGKKLGVAIDPQDSHYPAPWLCMRGTRPTGLIYLDWERWVREGIVDEIMVYCNGQQEAALNDVLNVTRGTPCQVSVIRGGEFAPEHRHFDGAGVRRVSVGSAHSIECGYAQEQPVEALEGADPLARMRVLEQITEGKAKADLGRIIKATKDSNLLVRRQALGALAAQPGPEAVKAIEDALGDEEHAVRCAAAEALSRNHGPDSVKKLLAAVKAHGNFQFDGAVASTLSKMKAERAADILAGAGDGDDRVRRVVAYSLRSGEVRPEALPALLKALSDPDAVVRFATAAGIGRLGRKDEIVGALLKALSDPNVSVQSRAAVSLSPFVRANTRQLNAQQSEALKTLSALFARFGDNYQDADADWGYRPIGNALLALGPMGKEALEAFLSQKENKKLAGLAWEILFVPQNGYTYCLTTEAEARKNYLRHPNLAAPATPARR